MKRRYRIIVTIGIFILSLISVGFSEDELTCVHYQDESALNGLKPDLHHKINSGNTASEITLIPPSQPDVYTLNIYVSFPDHPEHHDLPSFCTSIESSVQEYFEEMSYGSHHVHLSTAHRPSPNTTKCYIADNPAWVYGCCFCNRPECQNPSRQAGLGILTTEILSKAYADDPNIFNGIQMIFLNLTDRIFDHHTAVSTLGNHTFPHYNGPGTTQGFVDEDGLEWSIAHEYGHALGLGHPPGNDEKKYYGMYHLMYNRHQTNSSGEGGANPICGYHLYSTLHWLPSSRFVDVTSDLFDESIGDIRTSGKLYRLTINSGSNEHLYIENHQGTESDGLYNGTGLLIWHRRGSSIFDIECASGQWSGGNPDPIAGTDVLDDNIDVVYNGSAADFFDGVGNDNFSQLTNPCTNGYSGSSRHAPESIVSHKAILNICKVGSGPSDIKADFITNFWAGNLVSNTTWNSSSCPYYVGGEIIVSDATTLTIATGAVVNLNGHALHISGNGNIIRQAGVTVNPDIQLLSGYTLKGQYPTLAAAFAAAQPGDAIHLASDDTLHTAWEIPAGITFKLTNEASLVLEGDLDVAYGATFVVDEHTYIKCYDHIDIQGGTMEVGPGARLEFDHYSKIKVKGILNAEGTVSDRIVFTSHNGDWTGICFYEECDYESSQLRYCEMSLADYGVWCNYTSPDVKHCLIHDNDIGFYGYYVNSAQKISDNVFEHNHDYGIAISQGNEPDILRNEFTDGYSGTVGMAFWDANFSAYGLIEGNEISEQATGISGIRSDLQFKDNVVQNNSSYGILATSGTWVTMDYPGGANNVIRNNNRPGVYISSSGYGIMGMYLDNSQNSLYGNATYQLQYKGNKPGDPYVLAVGNYWGGCPVNPSWIYGNVDYTDALCYNPNASLSAPNPNLARTDAADSGLPNEITSTSDSITTAKKAAFQSVAKQDYPAAIEQFKWIIDHYPETADAGIALVHLNHCYNRLKEKRGLESYLETVCAKNRENELALTARYLQAPERIRRGERKESLQSYLAISRQTKNTELAADALFNAWQVCFNLLQDIPQAKGIYQTFAENYGKDNRLIILQLAHAAEDREKVMRTHEPIAELAQPAESVESTPLVVTEYQLHPAYPNPFNPNTTIGYQLPAAGEVSLKIYNLEGQLVRTLVQSSQTAGFHQAQWDATDDAGNAVAAGIYLCQMQAGVFRQTQRLVLLK